MRADALEAALTPATRAVVVTHLYGRLADMEGLLAVAERHRLTVIEDCAQAHGAERDGKRAGSFGRLACFSFYPTKNLGAIGDGGAVTSSDDILAARVRQLRQYGWGSKYSVTLAHGRNSRLDELQAAFLRIKLPLLDGWNARRRAIAARYAAGISHPDITLPALDGAAWIAHLYVVQCERRDALREHLEAHAIGADVHYPIPDHRQPLAHAPAPLAGGDGRDLRIGRVHGDELDRAALLEGGHGQLHDGDVRQPDLLPRLLHRHPGGAGRDLTHARR